MPEISNNKDDFDKQQKFIEEELGFDHVDTYKLINGKAHYGVNVVSISDDEEKIQQKRAYVTSPNPMHAMMEVWDSLMQQSLSNGLEQMSDFIRETMEESGMNADRVLAQVLNMLASEKFHASFMSTIQSVQPDLIVIGNPQIVQGFAVQSMGTAEDMTKQVENFLKEVVKDEEE